MQVGDTFEFNLTLGGDAETGTIVDVSDKTYSVRPKGAAKNVSYKLPKELVTLVKSKTKPINLANVLSSSDGMKGGNPPAGPTTFGNGGDGIPNGILGTDYYWGGGGGGGQFTPPANSIQNGGKGGGGGGATGPSPGTPAPGGTGDTNGLNPAGSGPTDGSPGGGNGAQCTGGGGGGDGRVYYSGGNGGSGIVIVAYPT